MSGIDVIKSIHDGWRENDNCIGCRNIIASVSKCDDMHKLEYVWRKREVYVVSWDVLLVLITVPAKWPWWWAWVQRNTHHGTVANMYSIRCNNPQKGKVPRRMHAELNRRGTVRWILEHLSALHAHFWGLHSLFSLLPNPEMLAAWSTCRHQ